MLRKSLVLTLLIAGAASEAAAQSPGPVLIGEFRDWTAAQQQAGNMKVCFAYSQPKSFEPKTVNRDPIYFYVTHRPGDGVKNEVSVKIGYPFRDESSPTVRVGDESFDMYVRNDTAWLVSTSEEAKLIQAMRKGASMTVKGTSRRGTTTTDTFSLSGIGAALDRIAQECR
jgi:hypothetical protein